MHENNTNTNKFQHIQKMLSQLNIQCAADQHDKVCELKRVLSEDPINWKKFLELDEELAVLSHQDDFDCSITWILSHYPPGYVIHTLLERYHNEVFANPEQMKKVLNIGLVSSIPEVVQFICSHYPYVLSQRLDEETGDYPIHRAQKMEIASIILAADPASIGYQNNKLDLPLHCALYHQQHPDHVNLLLERGLAMHTGGDEGKGGVLVPNRNGKTPFDILKGQFQCMDLATITSPIYEADRRLWQNFVSMICVIRGVNPRQAREMNLLHAIIELDCPPQAVRLGQIMTGQVSKIDELGRSPLHLACANSISGSRRVIENLVWGFPRAVYLADNNGQFPLHYAANGGRSFGDGIDIIYDANPSISNTPDRNGMLPYVLAANAGSSVDTIYRLMREIPPSI